MIRILCFLFFLSVFFNGYAQETVKTKEVTVRESYEDLVENNNKLFSENIALKREVAKLKKQRNVCNKRVKALGYKANSALTALNKQVSREEGISVRVNEDFLRMQSEINILTKEKEKLLQDKADDVYFQGWKKSEKELENLKSQLRVASIQNESRKEELGKAHYNLGNIFFQQGEYTLAAEEFSKTLEYRPKDGDACYNLAVIYDYYLKDSKLAEQYYQKYLIYNSNPNDLMTVRERIAENGFKQKIDATNSE